MGFLIAIANAASVSLQEVLTKKLTGEGRFFLIWVRIAGALPAMAILVSIFASWSVPPLPFWVLIIGVSAPLEIIAFWLGYTAIQKKQLPLSIAAPLHGFTAVFLIPVGYAILGEFPSQIGLVGVLSVFLGAFFLGRGGPGGGVLEAYRNLVRMPGAWFVLSGAFLVTIPISVAKLTFEYAPPLLVAFYITAAVALFLTPLAFYEGISIRIRGNGRFVGTSGAISGLSMSLHYVGLSLLPAAYFISTKRLSILFTILWGRVFFREDNIRERFIGGALMVAGVLLLALG